MEGDGEARDQRKNKEAGESGQSVAADRRMRKGEEEDSGGPAMRARGMKRKKDGLCHDCLAADLETERKIKQKEEEDERPAKKSRTSKGKDEENKEPSQKQSPGKGEVEEEDGRPNLKSKGSKRKKEEHENTPAKDGLQSSSSSGWEQNMPDLISCCPALVQDKIFELLSLRDKVRVAQVCPSWRAAVYRPCHWKGSTAKVKNLKDAICTLRTRQIKRVRLTAPCENLKELLVEYNTLEHFDISRWNSDIPFESLSGEKFESLKSLSLCIRNEQQMNSLNSCLKCFPNLEILSIKGTVTTRLLEAIVDQLKSLEHLHLFGEWQQGLILNLESLGGLKRLHGLQLKCFKLEGIESLRQVNSTLKKLRVFQCRIEECDWTPILSQLRSLTELEIVDCLPAVDCAGLRLLAQAHSTLKKFSWGNIGPRNSVTHEQIIMNDDRVSAVAEASGLQEIHVSCDVISDVGVLALCTKLRSLRILEMGACSAITSKGIEYISKLSSLTELTLANSPNKENWLENLAQGSCKLRKLRIFNLKTSDKCMQHLAQMSTLLDLTLRNVSIEPAGMVHLNDATFHLESLDIVYSKVAVRDLTPLLQKQTSLRRLTMVEEEGTPETAIPYLKSILPHLGKCCVFDWKPEKFSWLTLLPLLD